MKTETRQILDDITLHTSFYLMLLKTGVWGLGWLASVLFGILKLEHGFGGSCFIFSLSILIDFLPLSKNIETSIGKIFHRIFYTLLIATALMSFALLCGVTTEKWYQYTVFSFTIIIMLVLISFLIMTIISVEDIKRNKLPAEQSSSKTYNSSNPSQQLSENELIERFNISLSVGNLGSIGEEENKNE